MKIRTRLFLVLSTLGSLVAVVVIAAVTAFGELGASVATVVTVNVRSVDACADMTEALGLQDRGFLLLLADRAEPGSEAIRAGTERFTSAWEVVRAKADLQPDAEGGEPEAVAAIDASYRRFLAAVERFRAAPAAAADPAATRAVDVADYVAVARPYLDEVRDAVGRVAQINRARVDVVAKDVRRSGLRRSAWVVGVGILGIALAVLLARRLYRAIADPLDRVSRGIVAIGGGDLARRVAYDGRDELGVIAAAVNATAERLATLETTREGQLRLAQRLAGSILDSLQYPAVVVDRNGRMIMASRRARERLGDDPISTLRDGAGGIVPPGQIDARLESVFEERTSEIPQEPSDPLVIRPLIGPAGSVLGAIMFILDGSAVGAGAPGGRPGGRPGGPSR